LPAAWSCVIASVYGATGREFKSHQGIGWSSLKTEKASVPWLHGIGLLRPPPEQKIQGSNPAKGINAVVKTKYVGRYCEKNKDLLN
jgi:hypothetical protein